jgi:NitT/TauT family transport system substrate-binding protein
MARRFKPLIAAFTLLCIGLTGPVQAEPKKEFNFAWSIYVGWMPWPYAADAGIVKKWADKYNITINVVQINDYVESLNQYTAGKFDGVVAANMDALTIPAAGGIDTTALIVGAFSNGNDGIVLKKAKQLSDIKGRKVNLVEFSVSHYLLARGLDRAGLKEKDVTVVNTSDADIVAAFKAPQSTAVVTWNPQLSEARATPGATLVFDSSQIPGEIIDLAIVNTKVSADNPDFGKALTGIWYETLAAMADENKDNKKPREAMARLSGTDLKGFESQLRTTRMFYTPQEALQFIRSKQLVATMENVRQFAFANNLLGEGAKSVDVVGMAFPSGVTLGDAANIKLRFDDSFATLAAEGKL